jgi:hypothetical protein
MSPSKKVYSKKKTNSNRVGLANHSDHSSSKAKEGRPSAPTDTIDTSSQPFSLRPPPHSPQAIFDDFTHSAASSCNALVRCFGPATNPLSYFDPSTEGGQLIFEFYHDPCPSTTTDRYLQYILQPGYEDICRRQAHALTFALQASFSLIQIRKEQLHHDFLLLSASTSGPDVDSSFSASSPHRKSSGTGDSSSGAASAVPLACTPNSPSPFGEVSEDAYNLFHAQLWALNQAEQLWQWVDFIAQESLRVLDSKAGAPLYPVAPYNITSSLAQTIARKIPVTSLHPSIIASHFGLRSMDDVLKLEGKNVLYSILEGIQDYCKNPHFKANIARLKKMGILPADFVTTKLHFSHSMGLSTLRWLLMFYLEIPGFDRNKGILFEFKRKESDLPPHWRTVPSSKTPSGGAPFVAPKRGASAPATSSPTPANADSTPDASSSQSPDLAINNSSRVVADPTPTLSIEGDGGVETGWYRPIENTGSPSAATETEALARVVSTCDGIISGDK